MKTKKKQYIFSNFVCTTAETDVMANSYEEAVNIFLAGGGNTDEVDSNGGDWECILNPDEDTEEVSNET
tara:strand:- start:214 stop:420 length:207 start_codon:yes stop_codon:yes gene_type:complete